MSWSGLESLDATPLPSAATDVVPIYLRAAEGFISQKHNDAYEEAVGLLRKTKALLLQFGRDEEWAATIGRLRTEHKPKRNFMALAAKL
jgi:uncharacterized Zn finger protein